MMEFMRAGGFGSWVVLAVGVATLITAGLFARRPDERRMALIRGLSRATGFSILTALSTNVGAVMFRVPTHPEWAHSPDVHLIVMTGLGEALTPAMLGCALLTLSWLVTAIGMRRLSERLGALASVTVPAG
jgi:heme exporter protein D